MTKRALTALQRRQIRTQLTKRWSKYGVGGALKNKQPPPITLRDFEQTDATDSRVTPSPASAEREKAAPATTPLAGAAACAEHA